jgi:type I site-specific restriction-modification system R (restriction) subunit
MTTDTSERGLERLICTALTGHPCDPAKQDWVGRPATAYGGVGWIGGATQDYDREYCVELAQLSAFLRETQPDAAEVLDLGQDGPTRHKFLARLQGEISRRGTIDVLCHGIKHGPHHVDLFYGTSSPGNVKAQERYAANRFSVTRQLRYSRDETQLALDLGLFIDGLPVATFELKNNLTKQTVEDAVQQYKRDRDPREKLFEFGRCVAHFAVDDHEVRFCTHLKGKASWFLPFNQGWNDGAGNPPNPNGLKTDYLWKRILTRDGLTDILENYAQIFETRDERTGRKKRVQIWPRFQQLDVVRRLLTDTRQNGAGRRYLIQHSAGSGKSNSIAWLAHQLIGLAKDEAPVFDSITLVTDRRILDQQIRDTIKQFAQVGATVGHAEHSGDLRKFIGEGKKIIISTVQKFPFILDEIGSEHRGRSFAIIIDEAHSSQGGRTSAAVSLALGTAGAEEDDETTEDQINRLMEAKKLLPNASYFAFTATPKNKTLEIFGEPEAQADGAVQHRPFHSFLVCAEKFQTGYDEPLLHTMYVDKVLSGIKAVQTLSRLNRAHPQKHDVFVLDFMNDADTIQQAFADYYRTTFLAQETDPDKLHDLKAALDGYQVYSAAQIEDLVTLYLGGADRDRLDPILDACVAVYRAQLDEDGQVDFKGKAKAFLRSYGFLGQILPYTSAEWEKLSIFLNFLGPKLPAPVEEDLSKGVLEAIDMDSYRVEKRAAMQIQLPDEDAEIEPVPTSGGGRKPEPELDRLSNILKTFNDQFGNIPWTDADRVHKLITEDIPNRVAADTAYQNARRNSDKQNARIEHDKALARVMTAVLKDDTERFKQFMDNESFRRWLTDTVFALTFEETTES